MRASRRRAGGDEQSETQEEKEKAVINFLSKFPKPPNNLPIDIRAHYGKKGKINIDVNKILGIKNKNLHPRDYIPDYSKSWPFDKAREYVHKLDLNFEGPMIDTDRFTGYSKSATPPGNSSYETIKSGIQKWPFLYP